MFKSQVMGLAALTFLSEDVRAVKLGSNFRPLPGTAPWHKPVSESSWQDPTWKVDYPVPNFGVDENIITTQKNIASAEDSLKTTMHASFKQPKGHPVDYPVPNFGQDGEVKTSLLNTQEAEAELGHTMQASFKAPKGHPVDYFVPNFGKDEDVENTQKHIADQEKKQGHSFTTSFKPPKGHPVDYFVPDFGKDQDIKDTQAHIAQQEGIHGKWNPSQDENGVWNVPGAADNASYSYKANVQLEADVNLESDPICNSAGCTQYLHANKKLPYPVDYPVPNFGQDGHIKDSFENLDLAEKQLGHKWEF